MGQELRVKGYYAGVYDEGFVSTNMCTRLGMEFFLSQLLFKGDLKRVVYSKEDIAFRRRIETIGNGSIENNQYNHTNLDLPFVVYSQAGSYEPDDRGATQNAGQIVLGQVQPDSGLIVKSAAVKTSYSATAFFARRDDVNVASQLLYWESTPKFPVYFIVEHVICGYPVDIPVFITLDSFDSDVEYAEKDWLTRAKIFPIKMNFTVRSYQTLIEAIDDGIELPVRFSGLYGYNKNEELVLTEKTSLVWADLKWSPKQFEELNARIPVFDSNGCRIHLPQDFDPYARPEATAPLQNDGRFIRDELIDGTVADAIKGYFEDDRDCTLDTYFQNEEKTTENEISISWTMSESSLKNFNNIVVYVPGITRTQIDDKEVTSFEIKDLHPGSEYECTIIVTSASYVPITYNLKLKTKGEKVMGKKLEDNLIGKTFQEESTVTFTGHSIQRSLLGKELN